MRGEVFACEVLDDKFIYLAELPAGVNEMVVPCCDGYSIYISERLDHAQRLNAIGHALLHIERQDFGKDDADIQEIESSAHERR